jgi:hypothetical protein
MKMKSVHSVLLTIVLVVMALEMVLPFSSHHRFSAGGERTYYFLELTQRSNSAQPQDSAPANRLASATGTQARLLVTVSPAGDLPLFFAAQVLWTQRNVCNLFAPTYQMFVLPALLYTEAFSPSIEIPPRVA